MSNSKQRMDQHRAERFSASGAYPEKTDGFKIVNSTQKEFEEWFKSIPDVDETLLDSKLDHGRNYTNHNVERMWFAFKAGVEA